MRRNILDDEKAIREFEFERLENEASEAAEIRRLNEMDEDLNEAYDHFMDRLHCEELDREAEAARSIFDYPEDDYDPEEWVARRGYEEF